MRVIYIDNPTDEERALVWELAEAETAEGVGLVEATHRQGYAEICPAEGADGRYYAVRKMVGDPYMEVIL